MILRERTRPPLHPRGLLTWSRSDYPQKPFRSERDDCQTQLQTPVIQGKEAGRVRPDYSVRDSEWSPDEKGEREEYKS